MCDQYTVCVDPDPMGPMLGLMGAWGTVASVAAWMSAPDAQRARHSPWTPSTVAGNPSALDSARQHVHGLQELQDLQMAAWRVLHDAQQDKAGQARLFPANLALAHFRFGALHLDVQEAALKDWSRISQSISSVNRRSTRAMRELLSALTFEAVPIPDELRRNFASFAPAMNRILDCSSYAQAQQHMGHVAQSALRLMGDLVLVLEQAPLSGPA